MSRDAKTHNQIEHILIYRRWHSNVLSWEQTVILTIILEVADVTERLAKEVVSL
jgi:hypothetical protein